MTRGRKASVGDESIVNGYVYVCIADKKWKPKHRLLMERHIGRQLTPNERIKFKDGNRRNISIDNLELVKTKTTNRLRAIEERIEELNAQLYEIANSNEQVAEGVSVSVVPIIPQHKCFYCGDTATTTQYLIPANLVKESKSTKRNSIPNIPRVLSCQNCKLLLKDKYIDSLTAALRHVADSTTITERRSWAEALADWLATLPGPSGAI